VGQLFFIQSTLQNKTLLPMMTILLIGAGGREHALAWKIAQSVRCKKLFIAPGNPGTALHGENVGLDVLDFNAVAAFVKQNQVNMVVVGPEEPLVKGMADFFAADSSLKDVLFIGPGSEGARLEGSKAFAKAFMGRHNIPTAAYRDFTCDTLEQGKDFLGQLQAPYVLKADGLAAGKGVIISNDLQEARDTLEEMLCSDMFGGASAKVVVEEFLKGRELSVFVVTDGKNYCMLPAAKDYKRVGEADTGPNTGGMGAVSPVPFAGKDFMDKVEERIVKPTIKGLQQENIPYTGFIFFGLMEVKGDPFVIEYNVRMGDPETEAVIPRLESDLLSLLEAAGRGTLDQATVTFSSLSAATVMLVSGGYPGEFEKGFEIKDLDVCRNSLLFYAGMKQDGDILRTSGGRVVAVTTLAKDLPAALDVSYKNALVIDFRGKYFRRDIGKDVLK
jgi:phosphoribosylamine---glycine ligase